MRHALVHSEKDIEFARVGNKLEQLAIFDTRLSCARHCLNVMRVQLPAQAGRHALIKQDAHLRDDKHPVAGFLEESDRLFAGNGRKVFEKIFQRVAALNVVNQRAGRNPRTGKAGRATHYFRINFHNRTLLHANN